MDKKIINPYWGNEENTQVVCEFEYEDGTSLTASVMNTGDDEDNNPDWDQIFTEYSKEDIDSYTNDKLEKRKNNNDNRRAQDKASKEARKNEDIFQAKLDAFAIPEIKESKDRALKSKIRKATTLIEVAVYSTQLIMNETNTEEA